jgi:hypothetical protein
MTTCANIRQHLDAISPGELPKTFQDTVMLARVLGLNYVWIDSLCIVQNDTPDWHSEAGNMGTVYTNAALVIAAAGSKDPTEGLFTTARTQTKSCRLPYISGGISEGSFNIAIIPPKDKRPDNTPLRARGRACRNGT